MCPASCTVLHEGLGVGPGGRSAFPWWQWWVGLRGQAQAGLAACAAAMPGAAALGQAPPAHALLAGGCCQGLAGRAAAHAAAPNAHPGCWVHASPACCCTLHLPHHWQCWPPVAVRRGWGACLPHHWQCDPPVAVRKDWGACQRMTAAAASGARGWRTLGCWWVWAGMRWELGRKPGHLRMSVALWDVILMHLPSAAGWNHKEGACTHFHSALSLQSGGEYACIFGSAAHRLAAGQCPTG